jgi:hypothetical protein
MAPIRFAIRTYRRTADDRRKGSLAATLWEARFASGLLRLSYTINQDTTD